MRGRKEMLNRGGAHIRRRLSRLGTWPSTFISVIGQCAGCQDWGADKNPVSVTEACKGGRYCEHWEERVSGPQPHTIAFWKAQTGGQTNRGLRSCAVPMSKKAVAKRHLGPPVWLFALSGPATVRIALHFGRSASHGAKI